MEGECRGSTHLDGDLLKVAFPFFLRERGEGGGGGYVGAQVLDNTSALKSSQEPQSKCLSIIPAAL